MESYVIPNLLSKIDAQLHRSPRSTCQGTIFYVHGGGFMFGHLDDLPHEMIHRFNEQGYHVFAINYPLAPEAPLALITKSVMMAYTWWTTHRESVCRVTHPTTILFGRSAGAYLVQVIAHQLIKFHRTRPKGLILFYGYSHFDQPAFTLPSPAYSIYPRLSVQDVQPLRSVVIRTSAKPTERLPLYIHARQHGTWPNLLGLTPQTMEAMDMRPYIASFPPTFLAATPLDPDVPFENSETYARHHSRCRFYRAEGANHDFDQRDKKQRERVMDELFHWLSSLDHFE